MKKETLNKAEKLVTICEELCENITHALHRAYPHTKEHGRGHDFLIGKKYIKIVATTEGQPQSVWGFINIANNKFKLGDVLMAAGYNKPALNKARGNILDGYQISVNGPTHRVFGPDYLI